MIAREQAPSIAVAAVAHLARGLVREGDGEDGLGLDSALAHEVGDLGGDHPRFARAGAGEDEDGTSTAQAASFCSGFNFSRRMVDRPLKGSKKAGGGTGVPPGKVATAISVAALEEGPR